MSASRAVVDPGAGGSGEPVVRLLPPGKAGRNTVADHITTAQLAPAQLPKTHRRGQQTLIRCDSGGGTYEFVAWLAQRGRRLPYSVGMTITDAIHHTVLKIPATAWTAVAEPDGEIRDGAWVAELVGDVLDGWPKGMRLIVQQEPPHPGAQLRFTDADGMRLTCLPPTQPTRQSPSWSCATAGAPRAEDRIRAARATGLRTRPLRHRVGGLDNCSWPAKTQVERSRFGGGLPSRGMFQRKMPEPSLSDAAFRSLRSI
ncbi:transposase [Streptomyces cacaoi]